MLSDPLFGNLDQEDMTSRECVSEVILVCCRREPLLWQVIIKYRDATKAWSVGVHEDPRLAMEGAWLSHKGVRESETYYFSRRADAELRASFLKQMHGTTIKYTRVEFEPQKGYIVVAICYEDLPSDHPLRRAAEVRKPEWMGSGELKPDLEDEDFGDDLIEGTKEKVQGRRVQGKPRSSPRSSSGSDGGLTRKAMFDIWVQNHGKQPPSTWNKDVLREKLIEKGWL